MHFSNLKFSQFVLSVFPNPWLIFLNVVYIFMESFLLEVKSPYVCWF